MSATLSLPVESPFAPNAPQAYRRWREEKLARHPRRAEDLIVEVRDPRALRAAEVAEMRRRLRAANMVVYASPMAEVADRDIPRRVGESLGFSQIVANPLADADGISALEVTPEKSAQGFIPYSNRRLLWHTDGYYNPPQRRIGAFILHCVSPAATGGENALLDHEIAYILLRDADPAYVRALSRPDAMTIPANGMEGADFRGAQTGPVFSVVDGALHMRYTARTRSIEWRQDATTGAAVESLRQILDASSPLVFALKLAGGQGIVCNNVLHNRSAFTDDAASGRGRLVYRARYAQRAALGDASR